MRSWELSEALNKRPGAFRLIFDRSEIIDRNPTPGKIALTGTFHLGALSAQATLRVRTSYPTPPAGVVLDAEDPEVVTMFNRYEGYLRDREPLPSMAYFCLTVLEGLCGGDRSKAAKEYRIGKRVLNRVGKLTDKGGPGGARKHRGIAKELTLDETRFLKEAVKAIIYRVAEVAQDPDRCFQEITLEQLPKPHG